MKLIKPSFEIIEQPSGLEGMYKQIELIGRVSHKSEDRITEDSSKEFVDRMIKLGHGAVLEHGTVYLKVLLNNDLIMEDAWGENNSVSAYGRYINNKYSKVNWREGLENIFTTDTVEPGYAYITTNLRVLVENNWLDDLKYLCEPTEYHEKRVCVKFICDRGVSHEFVRHRHFSFMQESTRYCNYSKGKFNNELTFIIPSWLGLPEGSYSKGKVYTDLATPYLVKGTPEELLLLKLVGDELDYFDLLDKGWTPQQARAVLPNALKTELYMTGFISDWRHFFELRSNKYGKGGAHPQADELATPLYEEFKKRNLI